VITAFRAGLSTEVVGGTFRSVRQYRDRNGIALACALRTAGVQVGVP
jgi:hypothetical protein